MGRRRRQIVSKRLFEVCMKVRTALPFPAIETINLILSGILARVQRDHKVDIVQFLWMANHLHMLLIPKDAEQCTKFFSEVMKQCTDSIKRLLGLEYLSLWQGRPTVIEILDFEAAKNRLIYFYCNPARANLVEHIEEYPGYSSWREFLSLQGSGVSAIHTSTHPWIRLPFVKPLHSRCLSRHQDLLLAQKLSAASKQSHQLVLHINAWMGCFGITDSKLVTEINQGLVARIRTKEDDLKIARIRARKKVVGANNLRREPIMKAHKPKKTPNDRKVFFITTLQELALAFLQGFDNFCRRCTEAYFRWKEGNFAWDWPPGAMKPPFPPSANAI